MNYFLRLNTPSSASAVCHLNNFEFGYGIDANDAEMAKDVMGNMNKWVKMYSFYSFSFGSSFRIQKRFHLPKINLELIEKDWVYSNLDLEIAFKSTTLYSKYI